ncbi:MAG: hypothetical protein SGARI_006546 [Bacillariaceae sp.]
MATLKKALRLQGGIGPFCRMATTFFLPLLLISITTSSVAADGDFDGFLQQKQHDEAQESAYAQRLIEHEEWLQASWGGWAVRTIRGFAESIRPFAEAVVEATQDEETGDTLSPQKLLLYVGLRLYVVVMGLMLVYALSRLVQMIVGNGDIIIEEEVVIVHEHDTEEEAAKARAAQVRGKKQKAQ